MKNEAADPTTRAGARSQEPHRRAALGALKSVVEAKENIAMARQIIDAYHDRLFGT